MNKLGDSLIVSGQVLSECFCCDLSACKGICCVEGDSGAALTAEECTLLEQEWPTYAPYMQKIGISEKELANIIALNHGDKSAIQKDIAKWFNS